MKKTILAMLIFGVLFALHGCVTPEKTLFAFHIARGGGGTIEIRQLHLRSDAEGAKALQEVADYIAEFESHADPQARAEADESFLTHAENYTQEIGYDDEGQLNSKQRGEFASIFQLLEAMDLTSELELTTDQTFSFDWDAGILTLAWGWENETVEEDAEEVGNADEDDDEDLGFGSVEFVITTEGEFEFVSIGKLSADRKRVVIAEAELKAAEEAGVDHFEIRISGLASDAE